MKKKQREKWRAASSAYRERKKMANAVLDLTPPSTENIPPILVGVDVAQEQPQEQPENAGQAVEDPMPLNEDFNPPVFSTPERNKKKNTSAEKRCKKL